MKAPLSFYLNLVAAGIGQTLLLAFAWVFLRVLWAHGPVPLPLLAANFVLNNPTETMLITTVVGTALALLTTWTFSLALKAALQCHINSPAKLVHITAGITLAGCGIFRHRDYMLITISSVILAVLAIFMGSFWSTFIGPSLIAWDIPVSGLELDLNSTYFGSQLGTQLLLSGSALPQTNSLEVVDNGGLMSGIAAAQQTVGISEVLSFNGVIYNVSTGGTFPVVQGVGSTKSAQQGNTGLSFVGGRAAPSIGFQTPSYPAISSNFTVIQQGLTADVTCFEISSQTVSPLQTAPIPAPIFNGSDNYLIACAFGMSCPQGKATTLQSLAIVIEKVQGVPAQQYYVIGTNTTNVTSGDLLASLVCPYPVRQSGQDWSTFNVSSQGSGRYQFLGSTACQITPKLTTSLVTYNNNTLNVTTLTSTLLSSHNANLSLYLASIVQYQAQNSQGMQSNSIGDALYAVAAFTDIVSDDASYLSDGLLQEMEQYWRGVIEFFGTYLRSGFSAYPLNLPPDSKVPVSGNYTVVSEGWSKSHPIYLYTILPVTLFALFTYAAIGYALFCIFRHSKEYGEPAMLDVTDTLQLISASLTLGKYHNPDDLKVDGLLPENYEDMIVRASKVDKTKEPRHVDHGLVHHTDTSIRGSVASDHLKGDDLP